MLSADDSIFNVTQPAPDAPSEVSDKVTDAPSEVSDKVTDAPSEVSDKAPDAQSEAGTESVADDAQSERSSRLDDGQSERSEKVDQSTEKEDNNSNIEPSNENTAELPPVVSFIFISLSSLLHLFFRLFLRLSLAKKGKLLIIIEFHRVKRRRMLSLITST